MLFENSFVKNFFVKKYIKIKKIILNNIPHLCKHNNMFSIICQSKNYDIIFQIITEVAIEIKSASNDATRTNLIFLIPTALEYIAIV